MNDLLDEPIVVKADSADHIAHDEGDTVHDSRHVKGDEPLITVTPRKPDPEPEHALESPHPHQLYYPQPVVVDHVMPLAHQSRPVHEPQQVAENAEVTEQELMVENVQPLEPQMVPMMDQYGNTYLVPYHDPTYLSHGGFYQ